MKGYLQTLLLALISALAMLASAHGDTACGGAGQAVQIVAEARIDLPHAALLRAPRDQSGSNSSVTSNGLGGFAGR